MQPFNKILSNIRHRPFGPQSFIFKNHFLHNGSDFFYLHEFVVRLALVFLLYGT